MRPAVLLLMIAAMPLPVLAEELGAMHQFTELGKIIFALVLGLLVGLEREIMGKPAGMRTYALITAATASLVLLSIDLLLEFKGVFMAEELKADPIHTINAIIIGISFLGAGAILKDTDKNTIINLTTAATILAASGIGIASALSLYYLAIGLTVLIIIINWILLYPEKMLQEHMAKVREPKKIRLEQINSAIIILHRQERMHLPKKSMLKNNYICSSRIWTHGFYRLGNRGGSRVFSSPAHLCKEA